jgi:hypothetical protein
MRMRDALIMYRRVEEYPALEGRPGSRILVTANLKTDCPIANEKPLQLRFC